MRCAIRALTPSFVLLAFLTCPTVRAQTYTIIHSFTGGADGAKPFAGLTLDRAGNLYGTASEGGVVLDYCTAGCGTVFKLTRKNFVWLFSPIYSFGPSTGAGGYQPIAGITIGPDGNLYGTTEFATAGGQYCSSPGCGTVFELQPPASVCKSVFCPWTETELYAFQGAFDGANPGYGNVAFDQAGNIYGTTQSGGVVRCPQCGTVYELSRSQGWRESLLYVFSDYSGGEAPLSGVTFDSTGSLYGTTSVGGSGNCIVGCGVIYSLVSSGGSWTENLIYSFGGDNDGASPSAGITFDATGNLYGGTRSGGYHGGNCYTQGCGVIFQLSRSDGWSYDLLYTFAGQNSSPNGGLTGNLTMGADGSLYGSTSADGAYGFGNVFKLTHSGAGWTYTSLHDFTGGSDGSYPFGSVAVDANGNLYGTASAGGAYGNGVVWEIAP